MRQYPAFKGRGKIALAVRTAYLNKTVGLMPVGNASVFEMNVTETSEDIKDYTETAGGTDTNIRQVEKVEFDLSMLVHSAENVARVVAGSGTTDNEATAVIASEPHVLWPGAIVPLDHIPDRDVAIVVKSDDSVTTYVEGTDYIITEAGSIQHVEGSSIPEPTVTAGEGQPNIKVSYTSETHSVIQLLTQPTIEYVLHFDGVNLVTGKAAQFDLFRVRMSPAKKISGISDSAGKLDVTGSVMRDKSKPAGSGANLLSQYGTIKLTA